MVVVQDEMMSSVDFSVFVMDVDHPQFINIIMRLYNQHSRTPLAIAPPEQTDHTNVTKDEPTGTILRPEAATKNIHKTETDSTQSSDSVFEEFRSNSFPEDSFDQDYEPELEVVPSDLSMQAIVGKDSDTIVTSNVSDPPSTLLGDYLQEHYQQLPPFQTKSAPRLARYVDNKKIVKCNQFLAELGGDRGAIAQAIVAFDLRPLSLEQLEELVDLVPSRLECFAIRASRQVPIAITKAEGLFWDLVASLEDPLERVRDMVILLQIPDLMAVLKRGKNIQQVCWPLFSVCISECLCVQTECRQWMDTGVLLLTIEAALDSNMELSDSHLEYWKIKHCTSSNGDNVLMQVAASLPHDTRQMILDSSLDLKSNVKALETLKTLEKQIERAEEAAIVMRRIALDSSKTILKQVLEGIHRILFEAHFCLEQRTKIMKELAFSLHATSEDHVDVYFAARSLCRDIQEALQDSSLAGV